LTFCFSVSFPRKWESRKVAKNWIPAFAGMTTYFFRNNLAFGKTRFYRLCSANFSSQDSDINVVLHAPTGSIWDVFSKY